ncbi:hypothetical protein JK2ML_0907 [Mycobacterium leprae Kyoto-2]|uniref:Conserved membrane protein n=3 Tax=Mycobacterium leprae TaxID=1769 RepID=Q7AQC6_MYCLE|nr:hypothetical protein [Mycobacterium leprae]CAR71002.1 putative conserved membrane protein [Mycobacterium leprae Br4923]AWV47653.1 hypothetical protein DIJ64_04895 [Mycobacterium leprae]OAR21536.1 hypothetical protein A8144_05290 [Mycobacterium leprae 3125609]OAX71698.1 hypothetical protein A3216_04010 [Mycobacterium leprae 7935681]CAA18675.1 hypothetical protein MLCB268.09c [Mycobacterium leprae]
MKAQRDTPIRRGDSGRPGGRDGAARSGKRTANEAGSRRLRTHAGKISASAREVGVPKSGPRTSPMSRPVERPARPRNTTQAKARAKARKAKAPKVVRPRLGECLIARLALIDLRPRTLVNKVPFVVLVISSLGVGLGLTLWLSTDSAERSYQLGDAREQARMLQQQKEALERDVREAESAPALAETARKQGMIPTRDTAHLVQGPGGNWVVVGTPKPADGVPPPPLNTKLPDAGPPSLKPPEIPLEVPVRVVPGPGGPPPPARSGPQMWLRVPDGATTLGGQHLPQELPQLPGMLNGPAAAQVQVPGFMPTPGLPIPGSTMRVPVPAPAPTEVPVRLQPGLVSPAVTSPVISTSPVPTPVNSEQFGPVTATAPGTSR